MKIANKRRRIVVIVRSAVSRRESTDRTNRPRCRCQLYGSKISKYASFAALFEPKPQRGFTDLSGHPLDQRTRRY